MCFKILRVEHRCGCRCFLSRHIQKYLVCFSAHNRENGTLQSVLCTCTCMDVVCKIVQRMNIQIAHHETTYAVCKQIALVTGFEPGQEASQLDFNPAQNNINNNKHQLANHPSSVINRPLIYFFEAVWIQRGITHCTEDNTFIQGIMFPIVRFELTLVKTNLEQTLFRVKAWRSHRDVWLIMHGQEYWPFVCKCNHNSCSASQASHALTRPHLCVSLEVTHPRWRQTTQQPPRLVACWRPAYGHRHMSDIRSNNIHTRSTI